MKLGLLSALPASHLQEKDSGLDVFKMSDRDFLRSLENAIRFGKPCLLENVGEELDPALEPVLLKQVGLQGTDLGLDWGEAAPFPSCRVLGGAAQSSVSGAS